MTGDIKELAHDYERLETHNKLIEAIKKLDVREKLFVTLYYEEQLTYPEIANVIGITVKTLVGIHEQILKKLKIAVS